MTNMSIQLTWLASRNMSPPCGCPAIRTRTPTARAATPKKRRRLRDQRRSGSSASVLPVEGDAVQFHAMIDHPEAQLFRDLLLQLFQFGVDKFDHIAGFDIDQMVVMRFGRS